MAGEIKEQDIIGPLLAEKSFDCVSDFMGGSIECALNRKAADFGIRKNAGERLNIMRWRSKPAKIGAILVCRYEKRSSSLPGLFVLVSS